MAFLFPAFNPGVMVMSGLRVWFMVLAGVVLFGCAPKRAIHEDVTDRGPSVVSASIPVSERMTVAISRFTNETHYGSGLWVDEFGDRIGKQASDCLARHLMETNLFVVVEREDIGRLEQEAKLMGRDAAQFREQLKGVDALIMGSVVELGRETTGKSWVVGKSKEQRARARVVLRMVDPRTGVVFYSQEGSGDATISTSATMGFGGQSGYDSTLDGKAIDAAIVNMMNNVVATLRSHGRNPSESR